MPIIEISALPPRNDVDVPTALASITTAVASFLGEEPRGTWAIWRPVEPGAYAEGAEAPSVQPPDTHPAIVEVFAGRRDDAAMLMTVVGKAVVDAFGLHDGNVVVRLTDANPDHLYWGV